MSHPTINVARLKSRLIAASLNRRQYLTLRNTVRILAGIPLDDDQQKRVRQFQDVVDAYEEMHSDPGDPVIRRSEEPLGAL